MHQTVPNAWGIYIESSVTYRQSAEWYSKQKSIRRVQSSCGSVVHNDPQSTGCPV